MLVAINEDTNGKYANVIGRKGLEDRAMSDWLITDLSEELKTWATQEEVAERLSLNVTMKKQ